MALALLIVVIGAGAIFPLAQGYQESQLELRSGNLLLQEQAYLTRPSQTLFHRQTAAGTDAEAFDFGRAADGAIELAQTNAGAAEATDTGFYTASFSFLKFDNPTSLGYLHTPIGDPIHTTAPIFSSLVFPQMIKTDSFNPMSSFDGISAVGNAPPAEKIAGNATPVVNTTSVAHPPDVIGNTANIAGNATPDQSALDRARDAAVGNLSRMNADVRKQVSTEVGVEDTTNVLAITPRPTAAPSARPADEPATARAGNATNATGKANQTKAAAPTEFTPLPKSATLLTKPMARQANKPFTETLDPDYNPRKATRGEIQNISGWDRFTTNVIGRSGIDSTYMNRTSYPSYINPWNVIKLADQYKVMSDSANMTKADTWLNPRMWAL